MTAQELFDSETGSSTPTNAQVCPMMIGEGYPSSKNQCDCPKTRLALGYPECQTPDTKGCPVRKELFG